MDVNWADEEIDVETWFKTLTMLKELKAFKEIYCKEKAHLLIWSTFAYRHNGISRLWMHAHRSSASLSRSAWAVS